jgi:hypothetical protein
VDGQAIAISQAASGCSFVVTPATMNVPVGGGPGNVTVTAGAECPWETINPYAWITVVSGATGIGNERSVS